MSISYVGPDLDSPVHQILDVSASPITLDADSNHVVLDISPMEVPPEWSRGYQITLDTKKKQIVDVKPAYCNVYHYSDLEIDISWGKHDLENHPKGHLLVCKIGAFLEDEVICLQNPMRLFTVKGRPIPPEWVASTTYLNIDPVAKKVISANVMTYEPTKITRPEVTSQLMITGSPNPETFMVNAADYPKLGIVGHDNPSYQTCVVFRSEDNILVNRDQLSLSLSFMPPVPNYWTQTTAEKVFELLGPNVSCILSTTAILKDYSGDQKNVIKTVVIADLPSEYVQDDYAPPFDTLSWHSVDEVLKMFYTNAFVGNSLSPELLFIMGVISNAAKPKQ